MPVRTVFLVSRFAAFLCLPAVLLSALPRAAGASMPEVAKPSRPDLSAEALVMEESHVVSHFARDGSSVRTWSVRERIQSDAGVRTAGIISIPFGALTTTVHFDYVRVRKPSGQVIPSEADDAQEVPLPVTQQAPMYSDLRMKQLPVQSLGVGDTLEYQVTLTGTNADTPGAFWYPGEFTRGIPVVSEVSEVFVPRDVPVTVFSKDAKPVIHEQGTERVYRWEHNTLADYPKKQEKDTTAAVNLVQETFSPDFAISSFKTWAEFGAWYRGLFKERATPDAAIQAKADELTRGLTTDDAKVDALYRYVATQYRYIAVSLGVGRLQPHTAAEVFRNQYGDCKDKHTLLQAMLAAEKIEAEPVLISSSLRVNEAIPMLQFDHMITLVKLRDAAATRDVWLDATPEVAPARVLLVNLRDKLALPVPPTGDAALVRTPASLPVPGFLHETITGKLDANGTLTAHFDLSMRGDAEVIFRMVYHSIARAQWMQVSQQISYNRGFAGDVSAVDASVPEKTGEPFRLSYDYTRKDFGDWPNRRITGMSPAFEAKLAEDATPPKRAIELDSVAENVVKLTLELPAGYSIQPPPDVHKDTPFAEYTSTATLTGHTLHLDRTLRYKQRELPVSDFAAYRDFLKAVSDDAGQMMQLIGSEVKVAGTTATDDHASADLIRQAFEKEQAHDVQGARALLDQVKQKNERQFGLWFEYGRLDWYDKPKAIADYRKEIEYHPENFGAYPVLCGLLSFTGDYDGMRNAIGSWSRADPADPRAYAMLGGLAVGQKQYKQAEDAFDQAIKRSSEPAGYQIQLARAQLLAGDTEAGKATMHAAMDKSDNAGILNSAAYELAQSGVDLDAAEAASRKAIALLESRSASVALGSVKPEDFLNTASLVANWDTLGWILYKQQKANDAEPFIRLAWVLSPDIEIGEHLATLAEARGEKAESLTVWRQVLKLMGNRALPPAGADKKANATARVAALTAEGVKEKPEPPGPQGADPIAAVRTYRVASPLKGEYASADFLFLFGNSGAPDVRFLKGNDALKKIVPTLLPLSYRVALPPGSKARVLARGVLACTTGSKDCLLVVLPSAEANLADVSQITQP